MALFQTANSFHLGAYQAAVNAGLDAQGLSDADAIERDFFVHRAYVAMGQSSVRGGGAGEEGVGSGRADRPLGGAGGRVGAAGRRQNAFALLCFALL